MVPIVSLLICHFLLLLHPFFRGLRGNMIPVRVEQVARGRVLDAYVQQLVAIYVSHSFIHLRFIQVVSLSNFASIQLVLSNFVFLSNLFDPPLACLLHFLRSQVTENVLVGSIVFAWVVVDGVAILVPLEAPIYVVRMQLFGLLLVDIGRGDRRGQSTVFALSSLVVLTLISRQNSHLQLFSSVWRSLFQVGFLVLGSVIALFLWLIK